MVQSQPYPHMDVHAYLAAAHKVFLTWHRGGQDPEAAWWERSTATVWLAFIDIAREHQVPVNLNSLRLIRCTLLYDTMVTRLDPKIDVKIFQDYLDASAARMAARGSGQLRQRASGVEGQRALPPASVMVERGVTAIRRIDAATMQGRRVRLLQHGLAWELLRATRAAALAATVVALLLVAPFTLLGWRLLAAGGVGPQAARLAGWVDHPVPWLAAFAAWFVVQAVVRRRLRQPG